MSESKLRRHPASEDEMASGLVDLESLEPSETTEDAMARTTQGPDNTVVEETGERHQELEVRKQHRGKMRLEEP
jgi:hypothetical protein